MTDQTVAPAAADTDAHPSQIIEHVETHEVPRAGTLPEAEAPKEEAKPLSTRDAIAKAFDEAEKASKAEKEAKEAPKAEDTKGKAEDDKANAEEKPAKSRDETGKFAKAEKPAEQAEAKAEKGVPEKAAAERSAPEEPRQSEGRKYTEPPARFLPEARTKWANVPNEVKAEFHRVAEEYERELQEHKQFREELREYEELAKQHNVTIKDTMARYVAADRHLYQNFGQGVVQLMQMYGHNPVQGLSAIMQALGVTPQQFAEYVSKNPQAASAPQAARPVAPQPQPQAIPEVQQLKSEVEALKTQLVTASVTPIIERFASEHPDYHTLEPQIAQILKSGVIDQIYGTGLSPEQKLAEAYRMAGGNLSPSRSEPEPVPQHSDAAPPARPVDPDGQKSIKGAPTAGQTGQPKWVPKTNREALERAFASVR